MGCTPCARRRKATGWGSGTARIASGTPPETKPDNGPTKLRLPSGEIKEYPTRREAHLAKMQAGGGELIR